MLVRRLITHRWIKRVWNSCDRESRGTCKRIPACCRPRPHVGKCYILYSEHPGYVLTAFILERKPKVKYRYELIRAKSYERDPWFEQEQAVALGIRR